jgi:hypothetical protein
MSCPEEFGGFDPAFDDTRWTEEWVRVPVLQPPPGTHPSGYRIVHRVLEQADVFGRPYRLAAPLIGCFLYDPQGQLWMSDTPQERIMMVNNGQCSRGHVLVGGLGLGLYPQYAALSAVGEATRFTVIESSKAVRDLVEPTVRAALALPVEVRSGEVEAYLAGGVDVRYDTIFLDTWEALDATYLPAVNRLRDLALGHLAAGGQVLLWGYAWMVRLFEDACRHLLSIAPEARRFWLASQAGAGQRAADLLTPVVERFHGEVVGDMDAALAWCRHHIVHRVDPIQ